MSSTQPPPRAALDDVIEAYQRGDLARAEALCRELVAARPEDDRASLTLGGLLLHRQDFQAAAEVLDQALTRHADHPQLLVNQSIALRGLGRLDDAVAAARRACALQPRLLSAWNACGIALMESARHAEAEQVLREGLSHHPEDSVLLLHLSQAMQAQGLDAQAMQTMAGLRQAGSARGREAADLAARGHLGPAETRFREAIRLHPDDAVSLSGLGQLLLRLKRPDEAIECLERALALVPDDVATRHFLAAARDDSPPHADPAYVRTLFDAYADQFDEHLVNALDYRVPERLAGWIVARCEDGPGEVLDLGCGTGLVGQCIAGHATAVDGVDLSADMLLKARAKGIYRHLHLAELGSFVEQAKVRWQTVLAADVFIYYGEVAGLFRRLHPRMCAGGWLGFSVECNAGEGLRLDPASGRYQHGRDYLQRALREAGFDAIEFADTPIRRELGQAIPGWLVAARRC